MHKFDVIVVGAGGAGMMCAMQAGARGRKVCLIDHSPKVGRKILISGGGRCNFTNVHASPENYVSKNPHFCKSALSRYTPENFIALVRRHGIAYHEKKLGQLFCDGTADAIVTMLVRECEAVGAQFHMASAVSRIERMDNGFHLQVAERQYACESLVIATGGLSIPKIGATGFGYEVARQFSMAVVEPYPALVGFDLTNADQRRLSDLSGVSADSCVLVEGQSVRFRENILFTHTGLSGPAILQSSLYWSSGHSLIIDLSPDRDVAALLMEQKHKNGKSHPKQVLSEILPRRLAERLALAFSVDKPLSEIADQALGQLAAALHAWSITPAATFGYGKAEVTRGGVDTSGLSSKTMESHRVPGLYFIGEVVDVTGQLGGYNFQWAWASGFAAGQVV
jgi:predicted Rossmann fold flavoprotein